MLVNERRKRQLTVYCNETSPKKASDPALKPGNEWVYTPYITKNGKRLYRQGGKMWRFQVPIKK
jgi:hypothetical protein